MAANVMQYGFTRLADLASQRTYDVGVERVNTAIMQTVEQYEREINAMLNEFTQRTTSYTAVYNLPNVWEMQPLDEDGNPRPVVVSGSYDLAFPLWDVGIAYGTNRKSRAKMTVEEENRYTMAVWMSDRNWLRRQMLASLFTNVSYSFRDPEHGTLTVKPLANNDSDTYTVYGANAPTTANHYGAQANAISDADNPYDDIYNALSSYQANEGAEIYAYIPTGLVAATRGLETFYPAQLLDLNYPTTSLLTDEVVTSVPNAQNSSMARLGNRYLGTVDGNIHIVEWKSLPAGYILGIAHSPTNKLIAMREEPEPELQGLRPEFHSGDGNHQVKRFLRTAGFAPYNRVGAYVYRVGNGTYAIPTGYDARMVSL